VDFVIQGLSGAIVQEFIDVGLVPFLKVPNPSGSPGANAAWNEVFEVSMAVFPIIVAAGLLAAPFSEDGEKDLWRQGFRVVTVVFLIAISRPLLGLAIDVTNAVTLQLAPTSYTISVGKGTFDGLGTFFLTANAYLLAAIVMLWSTALVAILLTLRHVIVLFVYIGLPFLAVCWYADWGPMGAVSKFAARVMRMGIYALLVGPLLSIALRALEVISENGLVVAAGSDSLAVLWESLVIAALGPLMLVFITWKLISWAGEPMGFGAVTNAAAGVTQTALTVAAAGAGAAAGIGGTSGGAGTAAGSGGTGAMSAAGGSTGSVFGTTAAVGPSGAIGQSAGGSTARAGSAPSAGSGLAGGVGDGLGTDSIAGQTDAPAGVTADGSTGENGHPHAEARAPGMPGAKTTGPGRGMAADGGREPLIARSTDAGTPGSPSPASAPSGPPATTSTPSDLPSIAGAPSTSSPLATDTSASADTRVSAGPTTSATGSLTRGVLGEFDGQSATAAGGAGDRTSVSASVGSIGGGVFSPAADSIGELVHSGSLGRTGRAGRFSGVSTALSLATGDADVDRLLADRLAGSPAGPTGSSGDAPASSSSADDSGAFSGSVVSKTATKFTMNHGGRALRKGAAVAQDVGSDVAGVVAEEPSRVVGGALGGAAGSSVGGPVGTAVGTVVGSEAVRVGASAAMEYGYKQAYERVRGANVRTIGSRAYESLTDLLGNAPSISGTWGSNNNDNLDQGTIQGSKSYSEVRGNQ
jgi:hypothetical protein